MRLNSLDVVSISSEPSERAEERNDFAYEFQVELAKKLRASIENSGVITEAEDRKYKVKIGVLSSQRDVAFQVFVSRPMGDVEESAEEANESKKETDALGKKIKDHLAQAVGPLFLDVLSVTHQNMKSRSVR